MKKILQDFLYEAIYVPEGVEPPAREIIYQPELKIYYENFGTGEADYCIVADDDSRVIGAVWTRIMDDYGHVDEMHEKRTGHVSLMTKEDWMAER